MTLSIRATLRRTHRVLPFLFLSLLAACGGGGGSDSGATQAQSAERVAITGAGVKGPLAFARVEVFALDPTQDGLYDATAPLATATTNAYAQITGLAVPTDTPPPYILVVDGGSAVDRNTGQAPVIRKLYTVITRTALNSASPVYATPYTSLAYQMLAQKIKADGRLPRQLDDQLSAFNRDIVKALGFGMPDTIDVFSTPPVINDRTTDSAEQQQVVDYRAAIETLSSLLHEMLRASAAAPSADELLRRLAQDLNDDGVIDNRANGSVIGGIDTQMLSRDPSQVQIANSAYRVADIVTLIDDERAQVGDDSGVYFHKNRMQVAVRPAALDAGDDIPQPDVAEPTPAPAPQPVTPPVTDPVPPAAPPETEPAPEPEPEPSAPPVNDPVPSVPPVAAPPNPPVSQPAPSQDPADDATPPALVAVLKFDDVKQVNGFVKPGWQRLVTYLQTRNIKAGFGVIGESLANATPAYLAWIKTLQGSGLIEFWFHGWDHQTYSKNGVRYNEFVRPYAEMAKRLADSQRLAKQKLGFAFTTFGPPGGAGKGSFNADTLRLMVDDPDIRTMLYPQSMNALGREAEASADGKFKILDRVGAVNIEGSVGDPDFVRFRDGFKANPQRRYFVLQGHPANWDNARFAEFERIIDYLVARDAVFLTPTEAAAILR